MATYGHCATCKDHASYDPNVILYICSVHIVSYDLNVRVSVSHDPNVIYTRPYRDIYVILILSKILP